MSNPIAGYIFDITSITVTCQAICRDGTKINEQSDEITQLRQRIEDLARPPARCGIASDLDERETPPQKGRRD